MASVSLHHVHKVYAGQIPAVRDVTLDIRDEEFVVLVGPSGCGKTTTLRMVAGLEEVTSGEIQIGGRIVNDVAPKDRDIAMVFQSYALYPHMTVYKNLAFGLKLRKVPKAEIERRVAWAADLLGLKDLLDRRPRALSGGQRQRVAVGRAIVRQPQVFLFDEPLSNLDAKLRVTTRAELKRLQQELKTTSIYVTHDQEEAMTLGDRIVVMQQGRIQQVGTPLEVYRQPANRFVAGFVGMPPMNFFDGNLERRDGGALFQKGAWRVPLLGKRFVEMSIGDSRPVTLGIRPESLRLVDGPLPADHVDLPVVVDVVEMLGATVDIYSRLTTGDRVVARVEPQDIRPGASVTLSCSLHEVHLFDSDAPDPDVAGLTRFGRNLLEPRPSSQRQLIS
ncbi:MAG TPA: sn-glycerol-3-phosphate ABC transporter ATP-binding protein UgpC [Pirellulaceae bacterium]